MKKETVFKSEDGKEYKLMLTIGDLKKIERDIHNSLFAVFTDMSNGILSSFDLNFTESVLRHALPKVTPKGSTTSRTVSPDEADAVIEAHCLAGGTLDDINMVCFDALFATGLFTKGKNVDEATKKIAQLAGKA